MPDLQFHRPPTACRFQFSAHLRFASIWSVGAFVQRPADGAASWRTSTATGFVDLTGSYGVNLLGLRGFYKP